MNATKNVTANTTTARAYAYWCIPVIVVSCGISALNGCNQGGGSRQASSPLPPTSSAPTPPAPAAGINAQTNFAALMKRFSQGRAKNTPWAGYWWPYSDGGISDSAELYEQASGKTGAASWEEQNHGPTVQGIQDWWGHCNGWAAAASLFPEPTTPLTVSGVSFDVSDQKALLSEIAMEADSDFFGQRNDDDNPDSLTFQDIFPDQFFLVVANYLGNGLPLILDRYTGSQVWNQPIAAYATAPITPADVLPPDPSAPGVTRVNVTTQVWWARDDVAPDAVTGQFTYQDDDSFQSRVYQYEVWLDGPVKFDSSGQIQSSGDVILAKNGDTVTGGVWKGDETDIMNSHPDYLWSPHSVSPSSGLSNPEIDQSWVISHFAL